ncbi:MAG: hypothetical protein QM784_08850 [Polyangiaceae bacterium]
MMASRMAGVLGYSSLLWLGLACAPGQTSLGDHGAAGQGGMDTFGGTHNAGGTSGGTQNTGGTSGLGGSSSGGDGSATTATLPEGALWDGTSNRTTFGGKFWTFVDRSGLSYVVPDTGKVHPVEPWSTELKDGLTEGNGISYDNGAENLALHVTGTVAHAPPWSRSLYEVDPWKDNYWDTFFGSSCIDGDCREVNYPEAGLGVSLKDHNTVTDLRAYHGIAFRIRHGFGHGTDPISNEPYAVTLEAPMDSTDAPDLSLGDEFGAMLGNARFPSCTFTGTVLAESQQPAGDAKTCFAHFQKQIVPKPDWQSVCATWSDFSVPEWARSSSLWNTTLDSVTDHQVSMERVQTVG